jgi:hypothetical protein
LRIGVLQILDEVVSERPPADGQLPHSIASVAAGSDGTSNGTDDKAKDGAAGAPASGSDADKAAEAGSAAPQPRVKANLQYTTKSGSAVQMSKDWFVIKRSPMKDQA